MIRDGSGAVQPDASETWTEYAVRLQDIGHEEMFIRKAVLRHFRVELPDVVQFCDKLHLARLRHLTMLNLIHPGRSEYSMVRKVAKNLAISEETAKAWVIRHRVLGDVPFVGSDHPRMS